MQALPNEVLVYDLERHRAHCLNQTAALIWKHCDRQTSMVEMIRILGKEIEEASSRSGRVAGVGSTGKGMPAIGTGQWARRWCADVAAGGDAPDGMGVRGEVVDFPDFR